ncbi:MAG TPA: formyltransferase family protein [Elusimicrobiota bacterium]|nr:formyltransferase family protein [Elusimicrobiota bacterium]
MGRLLFLGKKGDPNSEKALKFCRAHVEDVSAHLGAWGDPLPAGAGRWEGDYIISYLSRWIVPEKLLKNAKIAAINFHPAPPEYPGIGCNNFALYDGAKEYGVTCHHMAARVDTGPIISVKRFPVHPSDDVASLLSKTYDCQYALFREIMDLILRGKKLPESKEEWTRKPFTRTQLDEISRITPEMSPEEIQRRVRATSYGPWNPTLELHGFTFEFKPKKKESDRPSS